ncbi:hypothetical protein K388_01902 [Streptomyces sp. KhCrAH-43]|uniref:hypothetical protein n=1 Tax=unclassified Streptomyces TaxID=2593676 RepID=UPI00035D4EDF|nr:hypothetical protein [Streptomyces sp. KhCrAH-43]MYS34904.1 hypothetical protein [Streptomyces sp. SID4920]MYX65319.1 hypothetical protein [Streptomyces sp. SID8373]RAJ64707.1 hypothetical protein K388_01902 [Streptomyces sp. KhCrAH-43]
MNTCQLCEQPDETGSYLCVGCTRATTVRLECLPDLYAGLLPFLAPSTAVAQGRGGKGGPAPLPVREEILDLRGPGGMVGVVEDWLAALRADRGWQPLVPAGSVEARLKSAVHGLHANMPWIATTWPQAGTFASEIRDLEKGVRSIIAPEPAADRGRRIGNCPALDPSGTLCGAVLRLAPGEKAVRCEWCGTAYPPYVWGQLKTWMAEDQAARDVA